MTDHTPGGDALVVRVLPDEPAIDREFDYRVPEEVLERATCPLDVGTIVRVDLKGRRVRGWVTAVGVEPPAGVQLSPVRKVTGVGPPAPVLELAAWASHNWIGPRPRFLRTATAERVVPAVPASPAGPASLGPLDQLSTEAFQRGGAVVRLAPCSDDWPLVAAAASLGRALVLTPTLDHARRLVSKLRRARVPTALYPRDWADSAAGQVTVGARSAAWAPLTDLDAVLVLDEHDEAFQEESAPTWHARDVALERARRDGAAWVVASPTPSLESLTCGAPLLTASRRSEREGWAVLEVADRRGEDPTTGEWCSEELTRVLRSGRRVVCVLNRKGRSKLAFCHQCGELARSEESGRPLGLDGDRLVDATGADDRPAVCSHCASTRFRRVKLGVTGVAEELERIARRPVVEVSGDGDRLPADAELYVGTEAVLHRVTSTDVVAFIDFDQELLAPRYRAEEEAFALLVRGARLLGPRSSGGRLLVQTRLAEHPVLDAVLHADPGRVARPMLQQRRMLRQPPSTTWATVSGASAPAFIERLGNPLGVEVLGTADGMWRLRSEERGVLLDALSAVERPPGRLRVALDPLRA
jgi:primosomal protein N' (replication factor Y) (superfamily II helicase)